MESNQKIKNSINKIYQKILLREPDRFGFDFYVSQVINGNLSLQDIEQQLSNSEEGISIKNFSHYSDKYWNDLLPIQKYKNKLATGNENTSWLEDLPERFKNSIPFKKVLIVGCGNGWLERELFDMFGFDVLGHPNLSRLIMPDEWEGNPLRKDYPLITEEVTFSHNREFKQDLVKSKPPTR